MLPSSFPREDIQTLAERTPGLSGSDLKETCREAAMLPLREYMKARGNDHAEMVKGVQEVSDCDSILLLALWWREKDAFSLVCMFFLSFYF